MKPKMPSIAIALGVPKKHAGAEDDEHEDMDDEGGDKDEHGVHATEEFCDAIKNGDYEKAWDAFKTMQALADNDDEEEESEEQ